MGRRKKRRINKMNKTIRGFKGSHILRQGKEEALSEKYSAVDREVDWAGWTYNVSKMAGKTTYDLVVRMPMRVYRKLFAYIGLTTDEISGMGIVERTEENELWIKDIFLFKQENTPASTILDVDDLAAAQYEMIKRGEDPSLMRLWWHSHCNMGVFWSGTDDKCCDMFDNDDWLISIVGNHKRELLCRLDIYKPYRVTIDGIQVIVDDNQNSVIKQITNECAKDIEEKVVEKTSSIITYPQHTQQGQFPGMGHHVPGVYCGMHGDDYDMCYTCGQYWIQCQCQPSEKVSSNIDKNREDDDVVLPFTMDDLAMQLYTTLDEKEEVTEQVLETTCSELFDMTEKLKWEGNTFQDCFLINWKWDANLKKYMAYSDGRFLSSEEYCDIASDAMLKFLEDWEPIKNDKN